MDAMHNWTDFYPCIHAEKETERVIYVHTYVHRVIRYIRYILICTFINHLYVYVYMCMYICMYHVKNIYKPHVRTHKKMCTYEVQYTYKKNMIVQKWCGIICIYIHIRMRLEKSWHLLWYSKPGGTAYFATLGIGREISK